MIYLDYASTTPLDPEVTEAMIEYLRTSYGNPSSKYYPEAEEAKRTLQQCRQQVADFIGTEPQYIIFNGGATEGNNFVIKGIYNTFQHKGNHIITTKIEHKSVLEPFKFLETQGATVTYLSIDEKGHICLDELEKAIRPDTILVSIMWANNEIGTLNDIKDIGKICNEKNVLLHTDATQVAGKIKINVKEVPVDFLTFSAHKLYGPKGVGAVYVGPDELGIRRKITPLLHGGDQEFKLRSGTHSMHNIVGLAKACEVAMRDFDKNMGHIKNLEKEFIDKLIEQFEDITFNGDIENKVPGIVSFALPHMNNELFLNFYSHEYALSTGSACSLGEPSYVLKELGKEFIAANTLRISIGKSNDQTIISMVDVLKQYMDQYTL